VVSWEQKKEGRRKEKRERRKRKGKGITIRGIDGGEQGEY
jgi:hypothetical protein